MLFISGLSKDDASDFAYRQMLFSLFPIFQSFVARIPNGGTTLPSFASQGRSRILAMERLV